MNLLSIYLSFLLFLDTLLHLRITRIVGVRMKTYNPGLSTGISRETMRLSTGIIE